MYHVLCFFAVRFNVWNPLQQVFTNVIHLSATNTLWIAYGHEWQTFSFHIIRGLEGKLRCHQNCLPSCVETWPSLQKAVDIWVSGLFSKDGDVSPLNKSFLLFNNLYNWDVPSHKELAFKIDQSFSILVEEIDYFVLFDHTLMLLQQRNSLYGDCTTGVGDISSMQWSRPSSNLCNFQ